jgi:hypothetical protein
MRGNRHRGQRTRSCQPYPIRLGYFFKLELANTGNQCPKACIREYFGTNAG